MKKHLTKVTTLISLQALPFIASAQWNPDNPSASELPDATMYEILEAIMSWLAMLLSILGVIGFLISGIVYITSAGNEERMELAKRGLIYSTIGLVVGLLGWVVVLTLDNLLTNV